MENLAGTSKVVTSLESLWICMVSRPSVNLNSDMIADESELGPYAPQVTKHSEYDYDGEVESSKCVLRKDDLEQLNDFERPPQTRTSHYTWVTTRIASQISKTQTIPFSVKVGTLKGTKNSFLHYGCQPPAPGTPL